jgi:hypothetical protein
MEDEIDTLPSQIDCEHMEQLLSLDTANFDPELLLNEGETKAVTMEVT